MNFLILGKPNVGKTSLYNILSGNHENIIHKTTGTTRDWHFSKLINNPNIKIFDSPGVINSKKKIIDENLLELFNQIDIFIYVIDFRNVEDLNDKEILNTIRKYNKEIILIINKDDNLKQNKNLKLFGIKIFFYISCSHNLGIDNLVDYLNNYKVKRKISTDYNYSLGLYGKTNVGKSTLLNKLVGFNRSLVSDKPKTTTDIVSSSYKYKGNIFLIKDTAGLIKKKKIDKDSLDYYATKKTLSIIDKIDINIFLIDVNQGFDTQSKKIFNLIYNKSNLLLFIINKIDLLKKDKTRIIKDLKSEINDEFSQAKNIHIIEISSLKNKYIKNLKDFIDNLTLSINKNISTSEINKWLKIVTERNPHSRVKGKDVKFKYATQVSAKPIIIKIFSNFSREISDQYKRFLLNNFYKKFKIKSKKVKIIISKSDNPYN
tara:strand:- start:1731 stop:3023 length:1293 start_codon:yes stop_codon:yes gene_type:complete